jgi:hypothetical protein
MRFTHPELQAFRGSTLPDLVGPAVKLLFVGFNPGCGPSPYRRTSPFGATDFIRRSSGPALSIG